MAHRFGNATRLREVARFMVAAEARMCVLVRTLLVADVLARADRRVSARSNNPSGGFSNGLRPNFLFPQKSQPPISEPTLGRRCIWYGTRSNRVDPSSRQASFARERMHGRQMSGLSSPL